MKKSNVKSITVAIKNGDDTKVKVDFKGGMFTVEEFTSMFMAVLETYTIGLLKVNSKEKVFDHFNRVFGIFLNKIIPAEEHYKRSKSHKEFKSVVDKTLGKKLTKKDKEEIGDNKLAAYLLCRDILIKDVGLTEQSVDIILNKRLGLVEPSNLA